MGGPRECEASAKAALLKAAPEQWTLADLERELVVPTKTAWGNAIGDGGAAAAAVVAGWLREKDFGSKCGASSPMATTSSISSISNSSSSSSSSSSSTTTTTSSSSSSSRQRRRVAVVITSQLRIFDAAHAAKLRSDLEGTTVFVASYPEYAAEADLLGVPPSNRVFADAPVLVHLLRRRGVALGSLATHNDTATPAAHKP